MSLFKSPTDSTDLYRFILAIIGREIPQISKQKIYEICVPFYPKTEQVKNLCKSVKSVGDSYPKNKYAIAIAAMTPAKSASKPQATA